MSTLLLGSLYRIDSLEKTEGAISARVTFDMGHSIFKGHFPDMPIVPGVCQTQILEEVLGQAMDKEFKLISAASIKFLSLVDPNKTTTLNLVVNFSPAEGLLYHVSAQYSWNETVFFKFKGTYSAQ